MKNGIPAELYTPRSKRIQVTKGAFERLNNKVTDLIEIIKKLDARLEKIEKANFKKNSQDKGKKDETK